MCGDSGARRRRAAALNETTIRRRTLFPRLICRGRRSLRLVACGVQHAATRRPGFAVRVEQGIHARDGLGWCGWNRHGKNTTVASAARPSHRIDGRIDGHDDGQNRHDRSSRELSSEGFHRPHHSPHSARGALLPSTLRIAAQSVNENSRRKVSVTRWLSGCHDGLYEMRTNTGRHVTWPL